MARKLLALIFVMVLTNCVLPLDISYAQTVIGPEFYTKESELPSFLDPRTWQFGLIPIVSFLWGAVQLLRMSIGQLKVDDKVFWASLCVSGGVTILYSWLLGYHLHSDFQFWKFLVLIAVGSGSTALLSFIVMRKSPFKDEWITALKNKSLSRRKIETGQCIFYLMVLIVGFWLLETNVDFNSPCDTRKCRQGELLVGDIQSATWLLWFFSIFAAMLLLAVIVSLWARWHFRKTNTDKDTKPLPQ